MSKGRRYSGEAKLNLKKVFAVLIAFVVLIMGIIMLKKVLTKAKNTKPLEINNYFALYKDNKWGILGSNGEAVIEPMYQEMPIVIDKNKDVFLCTYDIDDIQNTYKTKVVNSKNEEIFTEYEKVEALENYDEAQNVWYEENVLKVQKDGKWGLIDLNGKEILKPEYNSISTLKGIKNSLIIEKNGLFGLVNNKGIKILEPNYMEILNFGDDYKNGYITVSQENKYGLVNISGNKVLENKYEKIENIYSEKYFVIRESGKQKLINKEEKEVLTDGFDEITQIANQGVVFTKNKKYGLMDFTSNVLIDAEYEKLEEINTDIFAATKDGKVGAIDKDKNEKIPFTYVSVTYNKKAGVYIADDSSYISSIIDNNFDVKLIGILSEINIDNGFLKLKVDDTYKYYNFKFEEKTNQDILVTNKLFTSKKDGKYGFVDAKGNVVVDYIYDDAQEANKYGYAAVKKDGLWGAIDKQGNVVIEPHYDLSDNLVIDFIGKWHLGLDLNMNYYCEK